MGQMEKKRKDQGFSLIELLISIVILAIIIVPLLKYFITAAKINQKMEKIRTVEVTGINLLEAIKYRSIDSIKEQFKLDLMIPADWENFDLLPLYVDSHAYAEGLETLTSDEEHGVYEFAIIGLEIGSSLYDAVVSIDCSDYESGENEQTQYNGYQLPVMNQMNDAVAEIDMMAKIGGMDVDHLAVQEFMQRNQQYINEVQQRRTFMELEYQQQCSLVSEQIESGVSPTPTQVPVPNYPEIPTEYTAEQIASEMSKETVITCQKVDDHYELSAIAQYTLSDSVVLSEDSAQEQSFQVVIDQTNYENPINYLYLFYTPSIAKNVTEQITLNNMQSDTVIKAYLIEQGEAQTDAIPYCKLQKTNGSEQIMIYTNMVYSETRKEFELNGFLESDLAGEIERKSESEDWIYAIEVTIYEHEDEVAERYQNQVYQIVSTGVEE